MPHAAGNARSVLGPGAGCPHWHTIGGIRHMRQETPNLSQEWRTVSHKTVGLVPSGHRPQADCPALNGLAKPTQTSTRGVP